ncbi:MAG: acetyl-CoA carboxylase biotin carboxyl carrier protein [Oscillospiraceae bacterium]|nr:acetyl-CoA carboxylase biotin carboxyl carrier protein [Oscillospiraceae bacterium]
MENKEIRELAQIMIDMGLTTLDLNSRGESIRLERHAAPVFAAPVAHIEAQAANPVLAAGPREEAQPTAAASVLHEVKSPTVGTFYASSEPGKDAFVKVGDKVSKGETLCLLEAMKMLNEIHADKAGVVVEILAENKQVVEFGQPLFRIDVSGN